MIGLSRQILASLLLLLSFIFPLSAQNSHVDGNVPDPPHFHQYLKRDLGSFFEAESVEYELLREAPTQVGVSLPKYYLWVRAKDHRGQVVAEGACRVAAIEKNLFEVLQFLDKEGISKDPERVKSIFPAPLVPIILEKSRH